MSKSKREGIEVDACPGVGRVRKGETVPERFEAKPGDMKLVVFGSEIPFFNSPSDSLRSHGVETLGKGETPGALAFRTALEAVLS